MHVKRIIAMPNTEAAANLVEMFFFQNCTPFTNCIG